MNEEMLVLTAILMASVSFSLVFQKIVLRRK